MSTPSATDIFLVQRGTTQYQVPFSRLKEVADADLLLVQRGAVQHQVSGVDLKAYLAGGGPVLVPWTPADLPGIAAWFDFSDGDTITLSPEGDRITEIRSKVSGPLMEQGNANNQMWLVSDEFGGVTRAFGEIRTEAVVSVMPLTADIVGIRSYFGAGSIPNVQWSAFADGPGFNFHAGADNQIVNANADWAVAQRHKDRGGPETDRLASRHSGARTFFLLMPTVDVAGTRGIYGSGTMSISRGERFEWFLGRLPLALADQQRGEGYLAHKWGMDQLLPADHPYKNAPPMK